MCRLRALGGRKEIASDFASHLPWEIGLKIGRYSFTGP
jgi:hypothetical protein